MEKVKEEEKFFKISEKAIGMLLGFFNNKQVDELSKHAIFKQIEVLLSKELKPLEDELS